jgi:pimeloyl-ACP methyl ester carboxylesterase
MKPTLLLSGTRDEACPRPELERLAARLPPETQVHWLQGADHFMGDHLEELQEKITGFLAELK